MKDLLKQITLYRICVLLVFSITLFVFTAAGTATNETSVIVSTTNVTKFIDIVNKYERLGYKVDHYYPLKNSMADIQYTAILKK